MKPKDRNLAATLDKQLQTFDKAVRKLPGIGPPANRDAFIEQLIESIHRVKYIFAILKRNLAGPFDDPSSDLFDPLKAAILHKRLGQVDEAFWLVFLFVHFGKHLRTGYRLARDIYGSLGSGAHWNWNRVSAKPQRFRQWLAANETTLRGGDGIARHFGNHRKYESLDASSANGTAAVVESYVKWVGTTRTHVTLLQRARLEAGNDPRKLFDWLYRSMGSVSRFGRTARFDWLCMVGKLGLAAVEPGSAYMQGATGPLRGAQLLLGMPSASPRTVDSWLIQLESHLPMPFGMQVLEDALCNWQKSPSKFVPFRG